MPYCVHCGVEVDSGVSACPLCQTPISDPGDRGTPPPHPFYPQNPAPAIPKVSRRVVFALLALLLFIPTGVTVVCDLSLGGGISWSALVLGAAIALTACNAILLYCDLIAGYGKILLCGALWSAYTLFVKFWIEGQWKIPFAFPLVIYFTLALALLFVMARHSRRPRPLLLAALAFLLMGGACVQIEVAIHLFFDLPAHAIWSVYPAGAALLLAALCAVIHRSKSLQLRLKKKLFF